MLNGSYLCSAVLSMVWVASGPFATAYPSPSTMNYTDVNDPDFALMGYMTLPPALTAMDDPAASGDSMPAVVILPDWDNVNDYEIKRAEMISEELGYVAFTADIYGAGMHDIKDFNVKMEQATKYRSDFSLFNSRIQSAIETIKAQPFVDPNRVAIIGYCLGGSGVIGYSFANTVANTSDIVGAVSFHGGLTEFDVIGEMASPILVLSGGNDDAGTAVEDLEGRLKDANATWQITRYSGVEHGFTKFDSDAYNEWVDMRSWLEMSTFLAERFGQVDYGTAEPTKNVEYTVGLVDPGNVGVDASVERNSDGAMIMVETVDYDVEGFALEGYLAHNPSNTGEKRPAVLILPDWDGVNGPTGYEAGRAVLAAKGGYVAMVADIYGTEFTSVEDFQKRAELATKYRSDPDLYVKHIQAGVDQLVAHPEVDSTRIFLAGYCFGGTGAIDYAFSAETLENVRAVVPIHGGLTPLRAVQTDTVKPYVLILSGGVDDAHGNTTELEAHLDGAASTWEISRYSNAQHGFTKWDTSPASRYDAIADSRSWWSMMSLFDALSAQDISDEAVKVEVSDDKDSMTDTMTEVDEEGEKAYMNEDGSESIMENIDDSSATSISVIGVGVVAMFIIAFTF